MRPSRASGLASDAPRSEKERRSMTTHGRNAAVVTRVMRYQRIVGSRMSTRWPVSVACTSRNGPVRALPWLVYEETAEEIPQGVLDLAVTPPLPCCSPNRHSEPEAKNPSSYIARELPVTAQRVSAFVHDVPGPN